MANEDLADLITPRTADLQNHFDMKRTAMQPHVYGKLPSMESNMLHLRAEMVCIYVRQRNEMANKTPQVGTSN